MRARIRFRHLDERHARAAADVRDGGAPLELGDDAVETRQRHRDQHRAVPGSEHALDAAVSLEAEGVVRKPAAGAERLRQALEHAHLTGQAAERARREGRALLVGEDHRGLERHLEAAVSTVVEQSRARLAAQPFAYPAFVQAGLAGKILARDRAGAGERAIETEVIAEIDHAGDHRAAENAEHVLDGCFELLGIDRAGLVGHGGLLSRTLAGAQYASAVRAHKGMARASRRPCPPIIAAPLDDRPRPSHLAGGMSAPCADIVPAGTGFT